MKDAGLLDLFALTVAAVLGVAVLLHWLIARGGPRLAGAIVALTACAHRWCCGVSGHHDVLCFEPQRLSLFCDTCGRQTRGWQLTGPRKESRSR